MHLEHGMEFAITFTFMVTGHQLSFIRISESLSFHCLIWGIHDTKLFSVNVFALLHVKYVRIHKHSGVNEPMDIKSQ